MNKKYLYLLSAVFIIAPTLSLAVEPNTELEIVYDGGDRDPLNSAAIDVDGNILLSGARGNSSGATSNTYYLAKYDSYGREQWVSTYVTGFGSYYGQMNAIDVDRNGNTYMVISESYRFGSVIKFDSDGASQVLNDGASVPYYWDHSVGIKVDPSADIYVRKGNTVEKRDRAGTLIWSSQFLGETSNSVRDMIFDGADNLFATGKAWNSTESKYNAAVAKYDGFGNELWRYQTSGTSEAVAVSFDSSGNIVVLASERDDTYNTDLLILKLDPFGNLINSQSYDYGTVDLPRDFKVDENDFVYALMSGNNDFLTAKFAADGTQLWSQRYDGGRKDLPTALDVDIEGGVFVTGGFGNYDRRFVTIKYDTNGVQDWLKIDGDYGSWGSWIQFGRTGEVYVGGAGRFNSSNASMYRYRVCPCTNCP